MRKPFVNRSFMFISIFLLVLFSSCEKETVSTSEPSGPEQILHVSNQPFRMVSGTSFRLSVRPFKPLEGLPVRYEGDNIAGAGVGSATYIGDLKNVYNQLLIQYVDNFLPSYTINAPVLDVLNFKANGNALPWVQPNDFDNFKLANATLNVPKSVNGCIVNSVIYNDRGDAIFTSFITNSKIETLSPTRLSIIAQGKFLGGRGKFVDATGTFTQTLEVNLENFNDATYIIEGMISF